MALPPAFAHSPAPPQPRLRHALCRCAVGALLFFVAACDRGSHPDRLDRPAPQFSVNDGSAGFDLARYRGRVVILNLWASWCVPCVEELPSLLDLQQQLPGVTVVGVSIDKDAAAYRRFLAQHRVTLLTVRDPDAHINALYGTVQIPETYVIDRRGMLRRKFVGAQNWTSPELVRYLKTL